MTYNPKINLFVKSFKVLIPLERCFERVNIWPHYKYKQDQKFHVTEHVDIADLAGFFYLLSSCYLQQDTKGSTYCVPLKGFCKRPETQWKIFISYHKLNR